MLFFDSIFVSSVVVFYLVGFPAWSVSSDGFHSTVTMFLGIFVALGLYPVYCRQMTIAQRHL